MCSAGLHMPPYWGSMLFSSTNWRIAPSSLLSIKVNSLTFYKI